MLQSFGLPYAVGHKPSLIDSDLTEQWAVLRLFEARETRLFIERTSKSCQCLVAMHIRVLLRIHANQRARCLAMERAKTSRMGQTEAAIAILLSGAV